jgi:hypothetical protein
MELLFSHALRALPGLVALVALLLVLPRSRAGARLPLYIAIFILLRDAMTPVGLWSIGDEAFFWLRFSPKAAAMIGFGITSLVISSLMLLAEPQLRALVVWFSAPAGSETAETAPRSGSTDAGRSRSWRDVTGGVALGVVAAGVIAAPLLLVYSGVPIAERGGAVASRLLPAALAAALLGNLYEELLFRGFLQGYLLRRFALTPLHAAVASAVAFAAGHSFLAVTVTDVGAPLLLFVFYEGLICALVRMRRGTIPAAIAHGGAIFLLVGGVV